MNTIGGFLDMTEYAEALEKQGADLLKAELRRRLQCDINRFAEVKSEDSNEYGDVLYLTLKSIARTLKKFNIVDYEAHKDTPVINIEYAMDDVLDMLEERSAIEGPVEWEGGDI